MPTGSESMRAEGDTVRALAASVAPPTRPSRRKFLWV